MGGKLEREPDKSSDHEQGTHKRLSFVRPSKTFWIEKFSRGNWLLKTCETACDKLESSTEDNTVSKELEYFEEKKAIKKHKLCDKSNDYEYVEVER